MESNTLIEHAKQFNEATTALIAMNGMIAENMQRQVQGDSMAYTEKDFQELFLHHSLGYNACVEKSHRF